MSGDDIDDGEQAHGEVLLVAWLGSSPTVIVCSRWKRRVGVDGIVCET